MFSLIYFIVLKQDLMVYLSGMPNASIPTPQPVKQRKQFGAYGRAVGHNSVVFVSQVSPVTADSKPTLASSLYRSLIGFERGLFYFIIA